MVFGAGPLGQPWTRDPDRDLAVCGRGFAQSFLRTGRCFVGQQERKQGGNWRTRGHAAVATAAGGQGWGPGWGQCRAPRGKRDLGGVVQVRGWWRAGLVRHWWWVGCQCPPPSRARYCTLRKCCCPVLAKTVRRGGLEGGSGCRAEAAGKLAEAAKGPCLLRLVRLGQIQWELHGEVSQPHHATSVHPALSGAHVRDRPLGVTWAGISHVHGRSWQAAFARLRQRQSSRCCWHRGSQGGLPGWAAKRAPSAAGSPSYCTAGLSGKAHQTAYTAPICRQRTQPAFPVCP